ncbi:AAA family ATPase, partial [Bacillus mycoides]|uniref:AAA family ATPase n=1 Tax=Bacillus mycoides TaxID=1405 RepID=UPI003A80C4AD
MERLNERERKQVEVVKGKQNPVLNRLGLSKEDKEFISKDKQKVVDLGKPEVATTEPNVPNYRPQSPNTGQEEQVGMSIHVSAKDVRVGVPSAERLRELFQVAVRGDSYISEDKLASDEGIISFIGANNAGGSGLVANVADMYAMMGRKVLVVDLDINKRTQTLYFKNYERAVREHKGISNSLLKVAQGGEIQNAAVSVTSRVDVLSVSRDDVVDEDWADTIGAELGTFLADAREVYDVVLIDVPIRTLGYYVRHLGLVDKNVFVVENTMVALEDFFAITLAKFYAKDKLMVGELISKSSVILSKYKRGRRDEEGYELTYKRVKKMLESAGSPYDKMLVAGEIPYYENWEEQFFTGVRYIWKDDIALRVFKSIFTKAIV